MFFFIIFAIVYVSKNSSQCESIFGADRIIATKNIVFGLN